MFSTEGMGQPWISPINNLPVDKAREPRPSQTAEAFALKRSVVPLHSDSTIKSHLAQRPDGEWSESIGYGDGNIWNRMFEDTVKKNVEMMKSPGFTSEKLTEFSAKARGEIAKARNSEDSEEFGWPRNKLVCTPLSGPAYCYAIQRAVALEPNGKSYIQTRNRNSGKELTRETRGFINGQPVLLHSLNIWPDPLSNSELVRYIRLQHRPNPKIKLEIENDIREAGLKFYAEWHSPDPYEIDRVMPHIHSLIEKAVAGDLRKIPEIHWWYVQLAPVVRGPGGIAEMMTNAICRFHGIDLPSWADGIAPSVEVLLQPDMEAFCKNYHTLFSTDQALLEQIFRAGAAPDKAPPL